MGVKIGLIPLYDRKRDSVWMLPEYMKAIEKVGGIPIILPYTTNQEELEDVASICDGFLFTGGQDINPQLYGENKKSTCHELCEIRDTMEKILFSIACADDKPILGICRGLQILNVLCKGTLYQDLNTEYMSNTSHSMEPPYDRIVHFVDIEQKSLLYEWFSCDRLGVNSYHHQAIKKLGNGLEPMATSEDGLIEAFYMPKKKFVMAVQWHPELNYKIEKTSQILFKKFVDACSTEKGV